jgi:hypothetical protein
MKLFEFWTELPASILSMFPELNDELNQFSQMISHWSKKILFAQEIVAKQLSKLDINNISSETLDSLHIKLNVIEQEKTNLVVQGIKATTKILSEASKYLESLDFPSKDNMTQLKLTLKITRTIKEKILLELAEMKVVKENVHEKKSCSYTEEDKRYDSPVRNIENNASILNNHLSNTNNSNFESIENFLETLASFVDKIQSKLFSKSNQLINSLSKFSVNDSLNDKKITENIENHENNEIINDTNNNKIPNFVPSINKLEKIEQESSLEVSRDYLANINLKPKQKVSNNSTLRKRTSSTTCQSDFKVVDDKNSTSISLRKEKRKNKSKIILKKAAKKTSIFSYRTLCSSDSTSDNNSNFDLEKSSSEDIKQVKSFRD